MSHWPDPSPDLAPLTSLQGAVCKPQCPCTLSVCRRKPEVGGVPRVHAPEWTAPFRLHRVLTVLSFRGSFRSARLPFKEPEGRQQTGIDLPNRSGPACPRRRSRTKCQLGFASRGLSPSGGCCAWLRAHWTSAPGAEARIPGRKCIRSPTQPWTKQRLAVVKRNRREKLQKAVGTSAAPGSVDAQLLLF